MRKGDRQRPGKREERRGQFYAGQFTAEERKRVAAGEEAVTLLDEIWALRVMNLRILERVTTAAEREELTLEQLMEAAKALAAGAGRVAQLAGALKAADDEEGEYSLHAAIEQALDELEDGMGADWGQGPVGA